MDQFIALLPILIPSTIAVIGSIIAALIAARRGKESNNTDAFEAVTTQLFKLNTDLRTDVDGLKAEVILLKKQAIAKDEENSSLHHENGQLHEEMAVIRDELAEVKRRGGAVANYLGKLMGAWPPGLPMPEPEESIEWQPIISVRIDKIRKE